MILLITDKQDVHPNPVISKLSENRYPIFRLNTDALLTDYEFSWTVNNGSFDFFIKNKWTQLTCWGHEINAVWERRPSPPCEMIISTDNKNIEKFVIDEARGFIFDLRHFLGDRYSLGHPLFDCHSDSKMWQLRVAAELGMLTPDTVIANRKKDFVHFADKHESLLVKPINSDSIHDIEANEEKFFYSRKITNSELISANDESYSQTVCCLQEYVQKKYELRITVVHDYIFPCKIDSQVQREEEGKIDWRQGYDFGLKHEITEIPDYVKEFCLSYLRRMHINFGCFDFILTPDDRYVFLECNSNGQWLWIETETGLPISKAIADVLMSADQGLISYNNSSCY